MFDVGILNILFDKTFLVTLVVGIIAFATVVTLALPMMERSGLDDRLKSVARRREELRAKHHATLNAKRGSLRVEPTSFMKATLERFKLGNMLEGENSKDKLMSAGERGQAAWSLCAVPRRTTSLDQPVEESARTPHATQAEVKPVASRATEAAASHRAP